MSSAQVITAALRLWIVEQTQLGHPTEQVLASMMASGWDAAVAQRALDATLSPAENTALAVASDARAEHLPEPDLSGGRALLWAGDREVKVLLTLASPRLVVFGGLLSDDECDAMVALSAARLARSETVASTEGVSEVNAARTSDGMFFERAENEVVRRVEARLALLLNWPVEHGEGLQILRYGSGAEYLPHYDYFDPSGASTPDILLRGGQRLATVVMYLNTPAAGGVTTFPDVGLEVMPIKGNAVFFSYDRPHPDTQSLHGGAPVREGEKWVATKWLRQGIFV